MNRCFLKCITSYQKNSGCISTILSGSFLILFSEAYLPSNVLSSGSKQRREHNRTQIHLWIDKNKEKLKKLHYFSYSIIWPNPMKMDMVYPLLLLPIQQACDPTNILLERHGLEDEFDILIVSMMALFTELYPQQQNRIDIQSIYPTIKCLWCFLRHCLHQISGGRRRHWRLFTTLIHLCSGKNKANLKKLHYFGHSIIWPNPMKIDMVYPLLLQIWYPDCIHDGIIYWIISTTTKSDWCSINIHNYQILMMLFESITSIKRPIRW